MFRIVRTSVRVGLAAAAATGLVVSGIGTAEAVPLRAAASSGATALHVAITDNDLYLDGPTTFPAGRVNLSLEDARSKGQATVEVFQLASGYHWKDLRSDIRVAGQNLFNPNGGNKKKGLKALNHAIDHLKAFGGFSASNGKSVHGTLLLPAAGTYVLFDDTTNLPKRPHFLTVTSPVGPQTLPAADGNVIAKTNRRFGGDTTLPAKGTINFTNESTESPHFLSLIHVKKGTTRKDVINGLQSNGPPSFVLQGEADTDALTTGQSMNIHVNLPAGTYAELCFFPDPKTGMPHAFMGMVRIVHLK